MRWKSLWATLFTCFEKNAEKFFKWPSFPSWILMFILLEFESGPMGTLNKKEENYENSVDFQCTSVSVPF